MKHKINKSSRRDFIKKSAVAATAAAIPFGGVEAAKKNYNIQQNGTYDVAIVGGGVAGCYLAYRLANITISDLKPTSPLRSAFSGGKNKLSVALFEYSGRVGGRLLSASVQGVPDYFAEFGGFRFNRQMQIVWDTAQHLGLTDEVFNYDDTPAQAQNRVYIRGQNFTRGDFNESTTLGTLNLPYNLSSDEKNMTFGQLGEYPANKAFENVLPNGSGVTPNGFSTLKFQFHEAYNRTTWDTVKAISAQYEAAKQTTKVDGRLLIDWSWWALKRHFLSQEAVALIEDVGGYNTLESAGNVATNLDEDFYFAARTGSFPPVIETEWRHIKEGYAAIPGALQKGFDPSGTNTFVMHQLLAFDKVSGSDQYDLLFYKRERGPDIVKNFQSAEEICIQTPDKCVAVQANHVVLAMPKRSLDLLDQNNFFFNNPNVPKLLNSVDDVDAFRMFIAYPEPWWNKVYSTTPNGRCTTDLGLRQFYYWSETGPDSPALLLASYSNGQAEEYWKGLQKGQPFDQLAGSVTPQSLDAPQRGGPRHASREMTLAAHRQLAEFHGVDVNDIPEPYYAHFENWSKDPWGAGWHSWASGQNQDELIPQLRQPMPTENVYIVGECWSNVQGWVWGAMNTSEAVAQCNLGLKWPSFLRPLGTWLGPGTKWLTGDETDPCYDGLLKK